MNEAGGSSPLPYLQLLEIHQRRDDRASLRSRCARASSGASTPSRRSGARTSTSAARSRNIRRRWPACRRSGRRRCSRCRRSTACCFGASEGDDTFDFPAYRELLFLYSIARELAGNVETDFGSIDLFLPLEDAPTEPNLRAEGVFSVDLDVSGGPEDEHDRRARRAPRRPTRRHLSTRRPSGADAR